MMFDSLLVSTVLFLPAMINAMTPYNLFNSNTYQEDEISMWSRMFGEEAGICSKLSVINEAFDDCQNVTVGENPSVKVIYDTLDARCRSTGAIYDCMFMKFEAESCPDVLFGRLRRTLEFCYADFVQLPVQIFLGDRYNVMLSEKCINDVLEWTYNETCDRKNKPKLSLGYGVEEKIRWLERTFSWYIRCFHNSELGEFIPSCGLIRRDVYAILILSTAVYQPFGMNNYHMFASLMLVYLTINDLA